jgi:hypothetical protein
MLEVSSLVQNAFKFLFLTLILLKAEIDFANKR